MKVTSTESLSADEPVQQTQVAPLRVVGFQVLAVAELSSCHLCPYKKSTEWPICFFSPPTKGHLQRDSAFKQNVAGFSFWWPWEKYRGFCIGKILTLQFRLSINLEFYKEFCQHVSLFVKMPSFWMCVYLRCFVQETLHPALQSSEGGWGDCVSGSEEHWCFVLCNHDCDD